MTTNCASRLARALPLALVIAIAAPASARAAALPCQVPETNRHKLTWINLDGDRAKELVDVFNFDGAATPVTELMVCNSVKGELVRASLQPIWGPSPGSRDSGLRGAWVGDLDRADGRVEVAARNAVTPSAGEELVIVRQSSKRPLTFARVQTIAADTVTMTRPAGAAAYVTALVKATHASDGKSHSERWTYNPARRRWACSKDCLGRPEYSMTACNADVQGPLGTAARGIRVLGMSCAKAKRIIAKWMATPSLTTVERFRITAPRRYRVLGRSGTQAFWFALSGTD